MPSHPAERGFTLVEMIVALALLALISLAGLALVNSILAARLRTQGRLDRLADLERAMYMVRADLGQIADGPIDAGDGGIGFDRNAGRGTIGRAHVSYLAHDRVLERIVDGRSQTLLDGVQSARWSFYVTGRGWRGSWPPDPRQADAWPAAIALDIALAPAPNRPTGTLRRVVDLPAHP